MGARRRSGIPRPYRDLGLYIAELRKRRGLTQDVCSTKSACQSGFLR